MPRSGGDKPLLLVIASDHVTAHTCFKKINHSFIVLHLIENALAPAEKRLNVSTKFQMVAIVRLNYGQANSLSEFVESSICQPDVQGNNSAAITPSVPS